MRNILYKNYENEVKKLNEEFVGFLKTKGIKAKFSLAFNNMKESAHKQHEIDVKNFNEIKVNSRE